MKKLFVIAALATFATAAHAEEAAKDNAAATTATAPSAASTATVASTNTVGESVTALQDPEANIKGNWTFSAVNQTSLDAANLNYSNRTNKTVEALNLVGVGYKINKDNRVGFKQYFNYTHDGDSNENKTELSYPVLTYTRNFQGVAHSDPVTAMFWYYIPATATDHQVQNNGILRADVEFDWTLSPKWTVGYYLNPRQSFIPTATTIEVDGKATPMFAKTTLIHWGSIYYTVNDATTYYLNVGMRHDWNTKSHMAIAREQYLTNLGASFVFFGGKLTLNPQIDYLANLPRSGDNLKVATTYDEANLSYVMSTSVVF